MVAHEGQAILVTDSFFKNEFHFHVQCFMLGVAFAVSFLCYFQKILK